MYIAPDTKIYILKNVPLDNTYDHTIYFEDASSQFQWFERKAKYKLEKQSYQRVQRGVIRVGVRAESLYDCNYVMFQNSAFGTKWFYAFIKGIEYVNNNVSEITFELDVMQSWLINTDWELEICFVEREHTVSDDLFEHIVQENLEVGSDYKVRNNGEHVENLNDMNVEILVSRTPDNKPVSGTIVGNIYTALQQRGGALTTENLTKLNSEIEAYVKEGREDSIVTIYQYPRWIQRQGEKKNISIAVSFDDINGYKPKNKKLFMSPYNIMLVSNNAGQTAEFKFENWDNMKLERMATFIGAGAFVSTPCTIIYPTNHRGMAEDYDSGITLSNFPQCAWSGDTYKAWWAQNKASVAMSVIGTVVSTAAALYGANNNPNLSSVNPKVAEQASFAAQRATVQAAASSTATIASIVAKVSDLKSTPPQVHGQTQTDSLNPAMRRVQYNFYQMQIKPEFAEIVDDYFTRYGYACHKSKLPNVNARPHWTYTKTVGCTIKGSIPCDDMNAICRIFDNGITWWKNGDEIGNYNLDNSPV